VIGSHRESSIVDRRDTARPRLRRIEGSGIDAVISLEYGGPKSPPVDAGESARSPQAGSHVARSTKRRFPMRTVELVSKPVVTADTVEKIGRIEDLLVDRDCRRAVGVLVSEGPFSKQRVIPIEDVQTVGSDAVLVKTGSNVVEAPAWVEWARGTTRMSTLYGKHVVASDGAAIGTITGLVVDQQTGDVSSLEVLVSGHGHRTGHVTVAVDKAVALDRDVVVVSPDAVTDDETRGAADQV
jgi:sporulation protein YlmC with PRC-barrel domain